jgi:site-specific recombinase XerC
LVLLDTGVRVSELCGINIGDVDFEVGSIKVTGKGRKTHFVFLGRRSKQALSAYVSEQGKFYKDEPLFVGQGGIHRINSVAVQHMLKRLGEREEVQDTHPHRFRHTYAI